MDLLEGESLQRRLDRGGALDPAEAVVVVRRLCGAVTACHAAGVLHRDLKPGNVVVTAHGQPVLTDFGLARDADPSLSRTQLSVQGEFMGSPGFWSPEQAHGQLAAIGERTDVYGLGATLYALLTGRPPRTGESLMQLLDAMTQPVVRPSALESRVPRWLDAVIGRALAEDPQRRYATARELEQALSAGTTGSAAGRGGLLLALGIVVAGAAAAMGIASVGGPTSRAPAPTPAEQATDEATLPPPVEALAERGKQLYREGRYEEALQAYDEAIRLAPDAARLHRARGLTRTQLGDFEGAIEACDEALRLRPDLGGAALARATARARLNDHRGAIADTTLALDLGLKEENVYYAHYNRALNHAKLSEYEAALEGFAEAARLRPDEAQAVHMVGVAYAYLKDHQRAFEHCTEAIRLDPQLLKAHYQRAVSLRALGRFQEAIDGFTHSLTMDSELVDAYYGRGMCHLELGDDAGALADLSRYIETEPAEPELLYTRGVAYARLGRLELACQDWEEVLRLDPANVLARENLDRTRRTLAGGRGRGE
jgi:tetratricopeptide (TPR) repeat protein